MASRKGKRKGTFQQKVFAAAPPRRREPLLDAIVPQLQLVFSWDPGVAPMLIHSVSVNHQTVVTGAVDNQSPFGVTLKPAPSYAFGWALSPGIDVRGIVAVLVAPDGQKRLLKKSGVIQRGGIWADTAEVP